MIRKERELRCRFEIALVTDTLVVLLDKGACVPLIADIPLVIPMLARDLNGGLKHRHIICRDTDGAYTEVVIQDDRYELEPIESDSQVRHFDSVLAKELLGLY
ncbi:MAG TPA: hypothetical protein VLA39_02320 [Marinobacterium sp.]|nr:hypothetical protein [Marinobacterium sp.]